jgi:chromate transporter
VQIAAIVLGGVAGFWLCRKGPPASAGHMTMPVSRRVGLVALAAFFLLLELTFERQSDGLPQ